MIGFSQYAKISIEERADMKFNLNLEDIKYIKILYKDTNGSPCTIKAAIKSVNEREIIACAKFEDELNIEKPQDITLSVICNDGLYRTKTKLKSADFEEPYVFFALETPQGLEYQQNREYFRVPVKYDCIYTITTADKIKEFKTYTCDISANGISIFLPTHEISDESEIEIAFNDIKISARIRYVRSEKIENGYRLSFTYTAISNLDRDFISQVCIKKQLEQKRSSLK